MSFLPDITTFDKLMKNIWRTLFYGGRAETWDEKFISFICQTDKQISAFFKLIGRYIINYPMLSVVIFFGSVIVVGEFRSQIYEIDRRKRRLQNEPESEQREKIISEESPSVSHTGKEESENLIDRNDDDNQPESGLSSNTTIVASEKNEKNVLKNIIDSVEPGDDGATVEEKCKDTENFKEESELQESTRQKVDSKNCKHFYMLTPWIGDPVDPGDTEESCISTNFASPSPMIEEPKKSDSAMHKNFISITAEQREINKNAFVASKLVKPTSLPEAASTDGITDEPKSTGQTMRETANSTLAGPHETSSVCYADEVLSPTTDRENNIFSRQYSSLESEEQCQSPSVLPEIKMQRNNVERVIDNCPLKLPELDLSPISRNPEKMNKSVNIAASETRAESKNRFRSLSHDNRTASSAEYFDTRRGNSVSPLARNKPKQRATKAMSSKIPTLSPVAHRAMWHHQEADGSLSEAADQIRSVLLKRLREVWAQHPRATAQSPNRSRNPSFENSVYSSPEGVSRIPVPRRSPRHSNGNYQTPPSRLSGQSDRATDQSETSFSETTSECTSAKEDITALPLHSTPKTSPSSQGNNHQHN